jgi:hypothetical protein
MNDNRFASATPSHRQLQMNVSGHVTVSGARADGKEGRHG